MTDDEIESKLAGRSITQLTEEEKAYIRDRVIPPGAFSGEQRQLLKDWWLVIPPEKLEEFDLLNTKSDRKASWVLDLDGNKLLSASLLTDCDEGDTWGFMGDCLRSLPLKRVEQSQLASSLQTDLINS